MSKSKTMSKTSVGIEVTHLCSHRCNHSIKGNINNNKIDLKTEDLIRNQLRRQLCKTDDNIMSTQLESNDLSINDKSHQLRNSYKESELFGYIGSIEYGLKTRETLKKCLSKICANDVFANTIFTFYDRKLQTLKCLSKTDQFIPRQIFKSLKSFSFGSIVDLTEFVEHYSSDRLEPKLNVAKDDIRADFQNDRKRLDLIFRLTNDGIHGKQTKSIRYKLEYEYNSVKSITFSVNENFMRIYFTIKNPPILYKLAIDDMTAEEKAEYVRQNTRYDPRRPPHKQKTYKDLELGKGVHTYELPNHVDWIRVNEFLGCVPETIGKSNVLMVEIPLIKKESKLLSKNLADPYRLLYQIKLSSNSKLESKQIPIQFSYIQIHNSFENQSIKCKIIDKISVPFEVKYAIHSVFSHCFQSSDDLFLKNQTKEFCEKIEEFSAIDLKAIEETLFELSELIDRNVIFCSLNALKRIFVYIKQLNEMLETVDINSFDPEMVDIRRCILTPTRLLVLRPMPTYRSRFLVESEPDYTIRLTVAEDNLESLQFSVSLLFKTSNKPTFLSKVIKDPLIKGIKIGNRLYEFLGSSSSQLRNCGMILYAKDGSGRTAQSIRDSIGDMSAIITNVAKYVARLGLAFSQVMTHIEVDKSNTEVEKDIEFGVKLNEEKEPIFKRNKSGELLLQPYCFSDGIGRVSEIVMEKIWQKLEYECKYKPSAIQIRYGGCKGMLVLDPTLKGEKIIFRESMKKFESDSNKLGILKLSAPRPLYLNRPLITILEQLGVEPKVFLEMLMDNLKNLVKAMICECTATPILQKYSSLKISYRDLYYSGIPFLTEPLFRQIIDSIINFRIYELKRKARILVPMDCGRTVFGVLDETGLLESGQIFLQLSHVDENGNQTDQKPMILEKDIMVTKFPCLHSGDVRKLRAVRIEALEHIKDCIVFPQKGERPHPDEMAGSDLDGDEYAVIWDSPLIFNDPNQEPMNFPVTDPILLENDATVADVLDFYCKYIAGNNIGLLANSHLAFADRKPDGIYSDVCKNLAKKYAVALDFAKTGRVETIHWTERPNLYPDFMEKFSKKRSYLSKRVLGQLYRQCERFSLSMKTDKKVECKPEPNPDFILNGWEEYKQSATDAYNEYKNRMNYLLEKFGMDSEATVISGAVLEKTSKYMTGNSETNDLREMLKNLNNKLFYKFKTRFNDECLREDNSEEKRALRASAWYLIPFVIKDDSEERYFGFSWTITEEICKLMKRSGKPNKYYNNSHNCAEMATNILDEYFENYYIYREPNVESIPDLRDKRQKIMEERCMSSEVVLKAWLERQDDLSFKRRVNKKLISTTDYVMSDMDRKLRRQLWQKRIVMLSEAKDTNNELKSAGHLVMEFLLESVEQWLNIKTLDQNNRIIDTPLVKFGFSALKTLNHFFQTRDISHIILTNRAFRVSLKSPIRAETFYIDLPKTIKLGNRTEEQIKAIERQNEIFDRFVKYLVQNPEEFGEKLRRLSGAIDVFLEPYQLNTKELRHHYLLTVTGTVWSIQVIKNFVCHPSFFITVANTDQHWKKKNLFCTGMPDTRGSVPFRTTFRIIRENTNS